MSAPKGNQNATKGQQAATSWLQIRVTPGDKAAWVKAARESGTANLTEWVTRSLNATPELIDACADYLAEWDDTLAADYQDSPLESVANKARLALARAAYHH